jgi:hypothetical protein
MKNKMIYKNLFYSYLLDETHYNFSFFEDETTTAIVKGFSISIANRSNYSINHVIF